MVNKIIFSILTSIFWVAICSLQAAYAVSVPAGRPKVEVVFCLDTTGSMSGLIEGAKQKIWSIANQIMKGKPAPRISIGLVGYRDKGDAYVTKTFPLTDDIDAVYGNLVSFKAEGGGDSPEHVNKALDEAVHSMRWSNDRTTLKIIFLVGDCPPHTDYSDGYDYKAICREAATDNIVINTVQCGSVPETTPFWQEIAKLSEGRYACIQQDGGMRVVATPFDTGLARLNRELEGTIVAYGSASVRSKAAARTELASKMEASSAAERALYKADSEITADYDLVDKHHTNAVEVETLGVSELPEDLRGMDAWELKQYLEKKQEQRDTIKKEIDKLSAQRNLYLKEKPAENTAVASFESVVGETIKTEAARYGIEY